MMEAVADILSDRMRQPRGMSRTVMLSLLAHAVLLMAFFLMPSLTPRDEAERNVMQISLGGAPGPRARGHDADGRPSCAGPCSGRGDSACRSDGPRAKNARNDASLGTRAPGYAQDPGEDSASRGDVPNTDPWSRTAGRVGRG